MTHTWNGKPIPPFAIAASHPVDKMPDYMTEIGARNMAAMLLTAWLKNGHNNVTAVAVPTGSIGNQTIWSVRTNLIGGLPPRTNGAA